MTKFFIKSFFLLFVFNFLLGCQALKDGLEGNKKSKSAEEFLIEKKTLLFYHQITLNYHYQKKEKLMKQLY